MASLLNFTKSNIEGLPFTESGRVVYRDDGSKQSESSLRLFVGTQTKVFYFEKKLHGEKVRRRIGTFPEYPIEQARKDAKALSVGVNKGVDPQIEKRAARQKGLTLGPMVEQFIEHGQSRKKKPFRDNTVKNYQRALAVHFSSEKHDGKKPYSKPGKGWENRGANSITYNEVQAWYEEASEYSLTSVNSAVRCLKACYNHQISISRQQQNTTFIFNPFAGLIQESDPKRTKRLHYKPDNGKKTAWQYVAWFDAVDKLTNEATADYMRLLLLSGLRRRECASMRWDYVDLRTRLITLPGNVTKNGQEHSIPLSDVMLDLLSRRYKCRANDFVFPSELSKTGHLVEPKKAMDSINKKAGLDLTLHDLRRTYLQVMENVVKPEPSTRAVKQLINHTPSARDVTEANYSEPLPVEELFPIQQKVTNAIMRLAGRRKNKSNAVAFEAVQ